MRARCDTVMGMTKQTPQMIGYLVQASRVASRTQVYTGVTECSDCPDFRFTSQDVTECGPAYLRHWVETHAKAAAAARAA